MRGTTQTNSSSSTDQFAHAVKLTDVTMHDAIEALRRQGIPVCFEQVALLPERATRQADGSIVYERVHFDAAIPSGSVAAALNVLTAGDPTYRWEQVGQRPTYVVYPAEGSVLSWRVSQRDLAGINWIDAIRDLDLDAHGIALFPRGLERQPRVALDGFATEEQVARRWLALVMEYVGLGRYWNLGGVKESRTLVIGQVPLEPEIP
jgi:hypothetical protein